MPAGQVVQITINVTDGNAAEAVQQVVAELNAIGPAGERAGAEAGAGLDQVGEHALSARENIRLMNEDLGLRVPRAMQSVIANSQMMSSAIGAVGTAFVAIGAVEIISHMAEGVYNLYEKWFDVDAITAEYNKKLDEAALKKFLDPGNALSAIQNLQQINDQIDALNAKKDQSAATWGGMLGAGERYTPDDEKKRVALLGQQAQLNENADKYQNQSLELGISEMQKFAQTAEKTYQQIDDLKNLADQKSELDFNQGKFGQGPGAVDALQNQFQEHSLEASAKRIELQRSETDKLIGMQNEAVNAGLEGNALLAAKEQEEIAAVLRGYDSKQAKARETAAIQERFAAEALKAQQDLDQQTKHLADEAAQSGLTGISLIEAELKTRLDAIDAAEKKAVGPGGQESYFQRADFNSQRDSARQASNQKGIEEQQQYEEKIQSLMQSSENFELQGYARIEAETRKHLDELQKENLRQYPDLATALEEYEKQAGQIEFNADQQRQRLHEKTMEQITKEEQQAARLTLPEWQQAEMAIVDGYDDRLDKIQQDVKQHVMTEQEGARATIAAWQTAYAQMQKSEEETRDKLASGLQSLFQHPEQFFEKRAMDTAFQMMANEMLSVFKSDSPTGGILQYLFGMGPQMSTDTNLVNAGESALGMGIHKHGTAGMSSLTSSATNPAMTQFQTSTTTMASASTTFAGAVAQFASSAGMAGMGGGGIGSVGSGNFAMDGSTIGGAGYSGNPFPGSDETGLPSSSSAGSALSLGGGSSYTTAAGNSVVDASTLSGVGESSSLTGATLGAGSMAKGMSVAGGALMGATSIFSAYEDSNPVAGAVGGAMGGMEVGAAFGGPVGAAIGAAIGGVAGLLAGIFGDQGRGQAESLDVNTVQPTLLKDMQDYEAGRSGYSSIASELSSLLMSSQNSTASMGSGARNYFNSNIAPEINAAITSLQKQEIGGRGNVTFSAAQFHSGGWVSDFGDLGTSDSEGFIHAMQNEFVMNPMAAAAHAPILQAMNSGTNFAYASTVQPRMPASSGGGAVTLNIQALDSKSVATWAKGGGGLALMAALNQAQRQYSGVGRG